MNTSALKQISVGYVLANKGNNSKLITVFPTELLPFTEGAITDDVVTDTRNGFDSNGNPISATIQKTLGVMAEWKNQGNRITSPNVQKGETVYLYQLGKTERYYWEEAGRKDHLRRNEEVVFNWDASGKDSSQPVQPDDTNQYTLSVSGNNGHITVRTSQANGEVTTYTVQLNGKGGRFIVMDGKGNLMEMESKANAVRGKNTNGSVLEVVGDNLNGKAKNITLTADKVTVDGPTTFTKTVDIKGKLTGTIGKFDNLDSTILHGMGIDAALHLN